MDNQILFEEQQSFRQWWLWLILLGCSGIYLFSFLFKDRAFSGASSILMSLTSLLVLALIIAFWVYRLETQIKLDGIYVRFFPFTKKFKKYPINEITSATVRKYNPIMEYGGWGYRIGWGRKGKAFNVSGDQGLQLKFKNQKQLLIGTQKAIELSEAIDKLNFKK